MNPGEEISLLLALAKRGMVKPDTARIADLTGYSRRTVQSALAGRPGYEHAMQVIREKVAGSK